MNRKVTLGPEKIPANLSALGEYLDSTNEAGAPEDAKIRVETLPDGTALMVTVEFEEEA